MRISKSKMKRLNQSAGYHFFDSETMNFFNSKIETVPKNTYCLFITSEQYDNDSPRRYTIRRFDPETYKVETVSDFQQFGSLKQARRKMSYYATDARQAQPSTIKEVS